VSACRWTLPGVSANDLQHWPNNWKKSIALERHFLPNLFCCRQEVSRTKGISFEKSHADAARDGSKHSACFKSLRGINRRTSYPITLKSLKNRIITGCKPNNSCTKSPVYIQSAPLKTVTTFSSLSLYSLTVLSRLQP
jgi:hypothetical protein